MTFLTTNILIYALIVILILLVVLIIHLEIKLRKFLIGKDAKTLEDSIVSMKKNLDHLKDFEEESIVYFKNIEKRLKRSLQSVETIRFNPFKGTGAGGNQSFSTTFINEKGDGIIISSLCARERLSLFSKPIKKFSSELELTEEEKTVLKTATDSLSLK